MTVSFYGDNMGGNNPGVTIVATEGSPYSAATVANGSITNIKLANGVDDVVTKDSTAFITSGAVYTAIQEALAITALANTNG